jgi:hypothetical protein
MYLISLKVDKENKSDDKPESKTFGEAVPFYHLIPPLASKLKDW